MSCLSVYEFEDSEVAVENDYTVEYEETKTKIGYTYWSIKKGVSDERLSVMLDESDVDTVLRRMKPDFNFGALSSIEPVDHLHMQLCGTGKTPIIMALYDFAKVTDFTNTISTKSVRDFCKDLNIQLQNCSSDHEERRSSTPIPERSGGADEIQGFFSMMEKKFLGTFTIPIKSLKIASEEHAIRKINRLHVNDMKRYVKIEIDNGKECRFPNATGLIDRDIFSPAELEDGSVEVEILDGNHTLMVMKEVAEEYSGKNCLQYRKVDIYHSLSGPEVKALALAKNEENLLSRKTTDFEKITIMREEWKTFGREMSSEFLKHIYMMFNCICPNNAKEERKRKKIILHSAKIATMENTCWELVCKLQERKPGHSMYPYQNLGRLSVENGRDILLKALDQTINVSAMSKLICKLPEAADGEEMVLQRLRQRKDPCIVDKEKKHQHSEEPCRVDKAKKRQHSEESNDRAKRFEVDMEKEQNKRISELEEKCNALQVKNGILESKLAAKPEEFERTFKKMKMENEALRGEVAATKELKVEYSYLQTENDSLRRKVAVTKELELKCEKFEKELKKYTSTTKEMEMKIKDLEAENDRLNRSAATKEVLPFSTGMETTQDRTVNAMKDTTSKCGLVEYTGRRVFLGLLEGHSFIFAKKACGKVGEKLLIDDKCATINRKDKQKIDKKYLIYSFEALVIGNKIDLHDDQLKQIQYHVDHL